MTTRTSTPRPASTGPDLGRFQTLIAELAEERLAAASGTRHADGRRQIYEQHAELIDRDAIADLGAAAADDPVARALHAYTVEAWLDWKLLDLSERIERVESDAVIVWRGERLAYRSLPGRIAEIADRLERNALQGAYEQAVEAINPLREQRIRRLRELVVDLGYADYAECTAQIRGIDLAGLAAELRLFVNESETVYYAALRRYLAQIEIEQGDATLADTTHLFRAGTWDAWFATDDGLPAAKATLADLGFDLDHQTSVRVDLGVARWPGDSDALAVGVRIPDEVRLVGRVGPGYRWWEQLLHALGHAEQLANAPDALSAIADSGLSEAWAFLLDGLLLEPDWVVAQTGMDDHLAVAFSDFAAARRLYRLRLAAATLLYELRLHRTGDLRLARAYYGGLLSHLTGVIHPPAQFLTDARGFRSAAQLRGWMAAAGIADGLRSRFGAGWWRSSDAGGWLREAWALPVPKVEDAIARVGYDRLDWRPVLRKIRIHLVGEMSGYGGPNITTRAGTRKV